MQSQLARMKWSRTARLLIAVGCGLLLAAPTLASAAGDVPYALELGVLTGPQGGDLRIEVSPKPGEPAVSLLRQVRVQVDGELIRELKDVDAPGGVAGLKLGPVPRGATVNVKVHFRGDGTRRLLELRSETPARLRPDLVVTAVHAPPQTLSTRAIAVVADISERNSDTGAKATVTLMLGPTPVAAPKIVTLPASGSLSIPFEGVQLPTAMSAQLNVVIDGAEPFETDGTNNTGTTKVEVTEHELVRSNILVQSLGGYGAQFNQHVYAPISNVPPASLPGMEQVAKELEPQLVRIFYNDNWEEVMPTAPANLASFYKTVKLAQDAGATINITFHALNIARTNPSLSMAKFAAVLEDLVENKGYTNVRWVTVGNEPNSGTFPIAIWGQLYRALHAELVARGLRAHIKIMGGDLVEAPSGGPLVGIPNHREWFAYMAANMNDIIDAYSVHIYWRYHDTPRMEFRLKDVYKILTEELPVEARKPTYLMEFAVRGMDPYPAKPVPRYAFYEDGTEMRKSNLAAFQTLWFCIWSAQLGYTGAAKWDAYWGLYDNSSVGNQSYWMTGTPQEGWPLHPTYHALRLLMQTTAREWQVLQVAPWEDDDWALGTSDPPEKELVAFAGPDGLLTLTGLDTHGQLLNTTSPESPEYSIGGLPANTAFNLALWNATGNGESSLAGEVTTDAAGVARFEVPLHAAFSLTTVPVS